MPFKPGPIQPDFASLTISLANSRSQVKDNALYQTIFLLIKQVTQSRDLVIQDIEDINELVSAIIQATFWTEEDESVVLKNSRRVIAGSGISLNYTIDNQVTISASVSTVGYWTPLTDGNNDETDIIFASGEAVAVFVPTP